MSRTRFLLSLVVTLLLSALASANSAPADVAFLHSGMRVPGSLRTNFTPVSISLGVNAGMNTGNGTLALFLEKSANGNATPVTFLPGRHGTISHKNGDWAVWRQGKPPVAPMTAPEPGTLMLLSTGLIGIAGRVRHKLRRQ